MSQLIEQVYEAGIVGAGGAGFPTHVKMKGDIHTLIINAVECEPLLQVDKSLMRTQAKELIEGIRYILSELKIKNAVMGVKDKYKDIISILNEQINRSDAIVVKPVPNVYPVGDEVVLIKETIGINLKKGELPITQHLMVLNVETLLNIYNKIHNDQNVTRSYVTVIGEVSNPRTYCLPIGTSLQWILDNLSKPLIDDYRIVVGGPMTGNLAKGGEVVRKNTKAFIVLKKDHPLVRNMDEVDEKHLKRIMASCSQCRACTDMCPRHLLGHQVEPHKLMNAMANGLNEHMDASVLRTALGCVNCGVCELYACHHDLSPRKMMVKVKQAYGKQGIRPTPEGCIEPHSDRHYRRVPSNRLVMHLNLSQYDKALPFDNETVAVDQVWIPLNQHIGAPSTACVKVGDSVLHNQLIGVNNKEQLGANIHASISGTVTEVTDQIIHIVRR